MKRPTAWLPLAFVAVFITVVPSADERAAAHASGPCLGDCAELCGAAPVLVERWEYTVAACADDDMSYGPVPFGEVPAFCPVETDPMCLPREWVGCALVRRRAMISVDQRPGGALVPAGSPVGGGSVRLAAPGLHNAPSQAGVGNEGSLRPSPDGGR